jgi:hypothetical protein
MRECMQDLTSERIERELDSLTANKTPNNPYLGGEKLPTVAKKGHAGKQNERF